MNNPLPYEEIRFCTEKEKNSVSKEFFTNQGSNLLDDDPIGYILEVKTRNESFFVFTF